MLSKEIEEYLLPSNISLYILPSKKFKTNLIKIYMLGALDEDATKNALLPQILRRGTEKLPTMKDISRHLESLYGASFSSTIGKIGEWQIMEFGLEVACEKFLPKKVNIMKKGIAFLKEILLNPFTEFGVFKKEYLQQEKTVLKSLIESLINEKAAYAFRRLCEIMFKGEPFSIYGHGNVRDLHSINHKNLFDHHKKTLDASHIYIFVFGNVKGNAIKDEFLDHFSFNRKKIKKLADPHVRVPVKSVKRAKETLEVKQGKLCIGYRTNTSYRNKNLYSLVVLNGILGGFAHSRFFRKIREQACLAYSIGSVLEKTKGCLFITCGIDFDKFNPACDLIEKEIEGIRQGSISDAELNLTKMALLRNLKSIEDSAHGMIYYFFERIINKVREYPEDTLKKINAVKKSDVISAARRLKLDTIYFLKGR